MNEWKELQQKQRLKKKIQKEIALERFRVIEQLQDHPWDDRTWRILQHYLSENKTPLDAKELGISSGQIYHILKCGRNTEHLLLE